ncbi:MAG: type I methionyl aminopeptidase [Elusimicrobia bacterium RIFCSPLOWO2_01_FULL_54_10]|nr:MAG: type I methionyl aminopeptidase [Elusimicrobia bacterium RIFCSPLOWO2_01_FULL_54_10]
MNAVERRVELKSEKEIAALRAAGKLAAGLLNEVCAQVRPGITTDELDKVGAEFIRKNGAKPAFLGYRGFPKTICLSVNDEVVHGIPGGRKLAEGDILGVDVGVLLNGWYGDTARTVAVGQIDAQAQRLLIVSKESLERSMDAAKNGGRLGDISNAMQSVVEKAGFSVVREYGGHGIGRGLHEDPHVPCLGKAGTGVRLVPGMVLALEVMANAGMPEIDHKADDWTVVTKDGSLSAHFEHTVAITEKGTEVLTVI